MENKRLSIKLIILRLVILFVGLTIAHLGVTLFLLSDLGADPFNVLIQGLYKSIFGVTGWSILTHGRVHMVVSFFIIIVLLIVDRSYIKLGTLICMFCGGPIIDFFTVILEPVLNVNSPFAVRVISLALGCIILAFGMTIVIKSEAGTGPNDLVAVVISDKLKKPFSIVRVIVDVSFIVIGFLCGGRFGIGTIICAALVGPVAGVFMPFNERWINRFLMKQNVN